MPSRIKDNESLPGVLVLVVIAKVKIRSANVILLFDFGSIE